MTDQESVVSIETNNNHGIAMDAVDVYSSEQEFF